MPDVVTGGMAAVSAYSAYEGAEAADDANDLDAMQMRIAIERDEFNKDQIEQNTEWTTADREDFIARRERERGLLDPIQEGIVERANQGPDFAGAAARSDADVTQAYGIERDKMRRNEQRYGVNPSSGRMSAESRRFGNAEALAKAHGRNRSHLQEDDRDWARKIAAIGTGNIRNAAPGGRVEQLGVPTSSVVAGQQAGGARDDANAAFGLSGKLFADSVDRYDNRTPTPSVSRSEGAASVDPYFRGMR